MTERDNRASATSTSHSSQPLRAYDTLMGRGSGPNRWDGNRRFRDLALTIFQSYVKSQSREDGEVASFSELDPFVKKKLAHRVLTAILNENGRFLQKLKKSDWENAKVNFPTSIVIFDETEGTCESMETFVYVEASTKKATEKIKQTLRFLSDQKRARRLKKLDLQRKTSDGSVRTSLTTCVMGDSLSFAASSDAPSKSRLQDLMDLLDSAALSPEGIRNNCLTGSFNPTSTLMPPTAPAAFPLPNSSNLLVPSMESLVGSGVSLVSLLNLAPSLLMDVQRNLMLERELMVYALRSVSVAEDVLRKRLFATTSQQLLGRLSK